MTRRTTAVILIALVALGVFGGAAFLYQRDARQQAAEQAAAQSAVMVREHSPTMGPATASATIVEFFDPACEACRAFYPHVKQILAAYRRDACLVIRYLPFHREPSIAGVHILEAARQTAFPSRTRRACATWSGARSSAQASGHDYVAIADFRREIHTSLDRGDPCISCSGPFIRAGSRRSAGATR
tara:strand:- start:3821 stop:4378 length:558 start_codon:yes stop_codon:yes gene_type:complete